MVRAAHNPKVKGSSLIAANRAEIIRRADEPAVQLKYQINTFGKRPIPNSLKRAWAKSLEGFSEYQLAKYRLQKASVKTVDVIRLTHPARTKAIDLLYKNKLRQTDTWESIISVKGSNKDAWLEALEIMPHMALLRNLRNLTEKDIPVKDFSDKLLAGVEKGKQFPFRYYTAVDMLKRDSLLSPELQDLLESCLKESLKNMPYFSGKVVCLSDNSGSAHSRISGKSNRQISHIGNLMSYFTALNSDDGKVVIFGDRIREYLVNPTISTIDSLQEIKKLTGKVGGATEAGIWIYLDQAIRTKEHIDHLFIYSDMQAGYGKLYGPTSVIKSHIWGDARHDAQFIDVPKMINEYRQQVNPNVMVYLVQIAGYQDTLIPEYYDRTFILGGWSEQIVSFAAQMAKMYETT
jgi:hypothetical protein